MTAAVMPTLLPDRRGYALGDEVVRGFADRPELYRAQRARIARWAARFDGVQSGVQASGVATALDPETESLATDLIADREELQELHLSGLLDELDEQQRAWLAHPKTHPDVVGGRYPLSVGALAVLANSSEDQVRRWADSGVLPSFRVGVARRFGRAGAVRAMLLASASKPEKAVLSAVSRGQGRRVMLLLGAVVEDVLTRTEGLGSAERGQLAASLRLAADRLADEATSDCRIATPKADESSSGAPGRRPPGSGNRGQQALATINARPGITAAELAKAMGISPNYLYSVLPRLEQEGKVARQGKGFHPVAGAATPTATDGAGTRGGTAS